MKHLCFIWASSTVVELSIGESSVQHYCCVTVSHHAWIKAAVVAAAVAVVVLHSTQASRLDWNWMPIERNFFLNVSHRPSSFFSLSLLLSLNLFVLPRKYKSPYFSLSLSSSYQLRKERATGWSKGWLSHKYHAHNYLILRVCVHPLPQLPRPLSYYSHHPGCLYLYLVASEALERKA